ncbi:GvpL/GvpF family gas vesicle protein [Stackebrandtia nassauensis]|uniref:Gas vesicle synthesis GvpLGvpF n=1 Tax=Stackebrandtia nassauensis (strain DSM 44728 / CIP 108903 / NRRL B-16338 / NBRC 102104 / LLR-40K-21) TaxID=446470 RepID=D3Q7K6_STANL|nr:GvpL/GvpF family gas vesicle protein [Stackebrandtia nassauensis]ADD44348.1 Gas vesicle synthesis GvpLGvpF [Stackebrandtia nassauensis DSM 44728]
MTASPALTTVCFVYGIVPAETELDPELLGVGDPASQVSLVRSGDIAAAVSQIPADEPLGSYRDLQAHAQVLDRLAEDGPVLPMRFGAAMADEDAVAGELLANSHDDFHRSLENLRGLTQFLVKGSYESTAVLTEVVTEDPATSSLREAIRDKPPELTQPEQIELGKAIASALAQRRSADTEVLLARLAPLGAEFNVREPNGEYVAFRVAVLLHQERTGELGDILDDLSSEWEGRLNLRLVGPMAPYDFVPTPTNGN